MSKLRKISLFIIFLFSIYLIQSVYAYDNAEYGFSITPPTGWSIGEDTGNEFVVVIFRDPKLVAAINVVVEEVSDVTLSQYVTSGKRYAEAMSENYSLVSEGPRVVGELNGYQTDNTAIQNNETVKVRQVIFVENHKAYVITCGTIATEYSNMLADFENSINSFKITPTSQNDTTNSSQDYTLIGVLTIIAIVALVAIALYSVHNRKQKLMRMNNPIVTTSTLNSQIVNQNEIKSKFCRYCGMDNKKDAVFCEKCGKNIK